VNIFSQESDLVTAKACGCTSDKQSITYAFSESFHSLCLDKKAIIEAEVQACERLLKYATDDSERSVIEKEITELRMALDLLT
jgi:hypothetical protein